MPPARSSSSFSTAPSPSCAASATRCGPCASCWLRPCSTSRSICFSSSFFVGTSRAPPRPPFWRKPVASRWSSGVSAVTSCSRSATATSFSTAHSSSKASASASPPACSNAPSPSGLSPSWASSTASAPTRSRPTVRRARSTPSSCRSSSRSPAHCQPSADKTSVPVASTACMPAYASPCSSTSACASSCWPPSSPLAGR